MTGTARQIAVVLAALFNVVVNSLAGVGMLFGIDTGSVSDSVPTDVTPAGWAFSIWSLIFLGVLVFATYQALPRARGARLDAIGTPFVLANVLNGLWQFPWLTRNFGLSAFVIVGILVSLVSLYARLGRLELRPVERWLLRVPISLFLGWLTVAAPLNITVALVAAGWNPTPVWPPLLVLLLGAIGAAILWRKGDIAFAAVLIWAFAAIYARNVPDPGSEPVLAAALAGGGTLIVAGLVAALRGGRSLHPAAS